MTGEAQTDGRVAERTLFGHPIGLANLFGVELWERFSFYGFFLSRYRDLAFTPWVSRHMQGVH